MKIKELITLLQTAADKHGDIDLQLEMAIPFAEQEAGVKNYRTSSPWFIQAFDLKPWGEGFFELIEDKEEGDCLLLMLEGKLDGEIEEVKPRA